MLIPESITSSLLLCGYQPHLLRKNFALTSETTFPLIGFAQDPIDSRSACIAVINATEQPHAAVEACRPIGAPVVFVCHDRSLQWWKQGSKAAQFVETIPAENLDQFFQEHRDKFSPNLIYRAKTAGRFRVDHQLSFVDVGLLPLVEKEVGESLGRLIERNVEDCRQALGQTALTEVEGHWILKSIFWLVSAKILRDKSVPSFADLDLLNVVEAFKRLSQHYEASSPRVISPRHLAIIERAAKSIAGFASLALTTTESLAFVYENTLISRQTRTDLGTHSTPAFLVDYVLGSLTDWVSELPAESRTVFEPACGHAAFLVSALRLLNDCLSPQQSLPAKRGPYLRRQLHGCDCDTFALELARLSLTLTDIPNPNGWDLKQQDMFLNGSLSAEAKNCHILLANPPFERFTSKELRNYRASGFVPKFNNKAAEVLWQTLSSLPLGALFGVVLPQSLLHSRNAKDLRALLLRDFELKELCLFPDNVFTFSEAESFVLVGRRGSASRQSISYRRVRKGAELDTFRLNSISSPIFTIPKRVFTEHPSISLLIPDLQDVWTAYADSAKLSSIATVGQGLSFIAEEKSQGRVTHSQSFFEGAVHGFTKFDRRLLLHSEPLPQWMSLDPADILAARSGTRKGVPQVLMNYARVSRGPWRIKAFLDRRGRPFSSRFVAIRPTSNEVTIEVLWALLNSHFANAFMFSHQTGRENQVGLLRNFPIPSKDISMVHEAASAYLSGAVGGCSSDELKVLLRQLDLAVFRSYDISAEAQGRLLALFTGHRRLGIPFEESELLPESLLGSVTANDYFEWSKDWPSANRERGRLIDLFLADEITSSQQRKLESLDAYAEYYIDLHAGRPLDHLRLLEEQILGIAGGE